MPDIVAVAIVRENPPLVFIAEDQDTLNWVLALRLIAPTPGSHLAPEVRESLRASLLGERWGEAVLTWIEHNDVEVDVYSSESFFAATDVEFAAEELQFTPLFRD